MKLFTKKWSQCIRRSVGLLLAVMMLVSAFPVAAQEIPGGASSIGEGTSTSAPDGVTPDGEVDPTVAPTQEPEETPGADATPGPDATAAPSEQPTAAPSEAPTASPTSEASPSPSPTPGAEVRADVYPTESYLSLGGHNTYMSGYGDGSFRPDRTMTRAEMTMMIYNLLKTKPDSTASQFSDVSSSAWYYDSVTALSALGVVGGYSDGKFYPNKVITRGEFIKVLALCYPQKTGTVTFTDVQSNNWVYPYLSSAAAYGWVGGYADGTFRPAQMITRAEAAKLMNSALGRRDSGFAPDSRRKFFDVPTTHWAYKEVLEAAQPSATAPTPTPAPTPAPSVSYVRVTADALNMRSGPGTTYGVVAVLNKGTVLTVEDKSNASWYKVKTSAGTGGYVSSQYVENYNPSAATPVPTVAPKPTVAPSPSGGFVRVTADGGLNIRSGPGTTYSVLTVAATGTVLTLVSKSNAQWWQVKTSSGTVGYGSAEFLEDYTPGSASGASLSSTSLSIAQYQSVRLDGTVSSGLASMSWSSSNSDVARVGYTVGLGSSTKVAAMVYGNSPGTATITFSDAAGSVRASCTVTVGQPQAVRMGYTSHNIVALGENFDLKAITDTSKSAVRFEIAGGPASGSYETSSFDTESHNSSNGLPTNTVRIFRRSVSFGAPGLYTIRAFSSSGGGWSSDYAEFTIQVSSTTSTSRTETSFASRRMSSDGIQLISYYEGLLPEIEDDSLAPGNPTVGHGLVIRANGKFYNNLTKAEAFAILVETVNEEYYAKAVESFRANNNLKMSQAQFDALTSFAYNLGPGVITSEYGTFRVVLNAVTPPNASEGNPYGGTLNVGDANIYSSDSASSSIVTTLSLGTNVSVVGSSVKSSTKEVWYKVKAGSASGWIRAGNVALSGAGSMTHDLAYVDSMTFSENFMLWHKSSGKCWSGLIYRRLSEAKLFLYGNYEEASPYSPRYHKNTYGFPYPGCCQRYDER